jgi:hypothetical protein
MRHPFGGIIVRPSPCRADGAPQPQVSVAAPTAMPEQVVAGPEAAPVRMQRRSWIQRLLGAAGAVLAGRWMTAPPAAALAQGPSSEGEPVPQRTTHDRYLVVPDDFRQFSARRREELGVLGNHFSSMNSKQQRGSGGFLAWLTPEQAQQLAAEADVAEVLALTADDIPGPGEATFGATNLLVVLAPNSWSKLPPRDTFATTAQVVAAWSKQFADLKGVAFRAVPRSAGHVVVDLPDGKIPDGLLDGLKQHRQVVGIHWAVPATTQAGNEEGGVTTQALGEEGATTRAAGEEGATTKALGEEGATTLRVGEEGATTRALGEEGQPPPPTTNALGEEGQPQITTLAGGEEGAASRGLREQGASTERLGEEGW